MEITKTERYEIELGEYEVEVRYYPTEHRVEVEPDILNPRNGMDDQDILQDRLGLRYEAESYGEPARYFIEVFLDDESGLGIIDEDENLEQLLEPKE